MLQVKTLVLQEQDFQSGKFPQKFAMSHFKDDEVSAAFCTSELVFANGVCVKDRAGLMGKPVIAPVSLQKENGCDQSCISLEMRATLKKVAEQEADNVQLWQKVRKLEAENQSLKDENQEIDGLLDDIAAFRAAQLATQAVIEDVIATLTDSEITDGDMDEAVRLLRRALDF